MATPTPPAPRKPYPSDISDEEWALVAPYLTLVREDAPQRRHDLREVFNALRWLARTGTEWRRGGCHSTSPAGRRSTNRPGAGWPPGCFEAVVHDLRLLLR